MFLQKPKRPPRDDLRNPAWLEDERIGDGPIMYINKREAAFWRQMMARYLYPIVMDKDQKKRLSDELISLRNNVRGTTLRLVFHVIFYLTSVII